jgi:hypothetical protein
VHDATELAAGPSAEVATPIRLVGVVTAVEAGAVEVDEPIAGRAESQAGAPARRLHAPHSVEAVEEVGLGRPVVLRRSMKDRLQRVVAADRAFRLVRPAASRL